MEDTVTPSRPDEETPAVRTRPASPEKSAAFSRGISKLFDKARLPVYCLVSSVLVHFLFLYAWSMFGAYQFSTTVNLPQAAVIHLVDPGATAFAPVTPQEEPANGRPQVREEAQFAQIPPQAPPADTTPATPRLPKPEPESTATPVADARGGEAAIPDQGMDKAGPPDQPPLPTAPSSSRGGESPSAKYEKLTYQISMLGLPVGSAELESKHEDGVTSITLRVRSNSAISGIFPVDDVVETKLISGRYIMTKIRQQEGSFRSDEMFTINRVKKRVNWNDFVNRRSLQLILPTDDVLDSLSAVYFLRNRQLQVGRPETLHIYDSEIYAEVPVEILRREDLRQPNLTMVDTLVVRPLQKTTGIFRRTGEVVIWLTNDAKKVPVKIVTSIALGKVTVELISAETAPHGKQVEETARQVRPAVD